MNYGINKPNKPANENIKRARNNKLRSTTFIILGTICWGIVVKNIAMAKNLENPAITSNNEENK